MNNSNQWTSLSIEDSLDALQSSPQGISKASADERLDKFGLNELVSTHHISPWNILLEQFKNVLIIILLIAVSISFMLGHTVESVVIIIIVLFAVFLGFIQEYRAEKAIDALKQMAAPTATVIRDGTEITIPAKFVVPGDIVVLKAGDRIPADGRIIQSINLQTDEAALTGESLPVPKKSNETCAPEAAVGDQYNMVFSGTAVSYGRGTAVVVSTAEHTEFGKIAKLLQGVQSEKTPLQINLDKIGKSLAKATLVIVFLIVIFGLLRGMPFIEMLVFGIALAVAIVPEALPAVVTISLAIGVQKMVKRNALIRKLPAVETLGSTSVICSDKTGTLTKDEMTIKEIFTAGLHFDVTGTGYTPTGDFLQNGVPVSPTETVLFPLLQAGSLVNDAEVYCENDQWKIKGDPTEAALIVAAAKANIDKQLIDKQYPRIGEIPFTSETKRMTTLHTVEGDTIAYAKGAPEVILDSCSYYWDGHEDRPLDDNTRDMIFQTAEKMSNKALRILAVASKQIIEQCDAEHQMTFMGIAGMIDPPREEVKNAIQTCESAGIRAVMITGDHPSTAKAVARELGMLKTGTVMTEAELNRIDDDIFLEKVKSVEVYARVSPAHKLKIVEALQQNKQIVAMTGDGINDAPALKKADIGIAMGITGTDVSKEAADMMLTDDNFTSIVAAVEEGRSIFDNIKKYLMYLLSSNIGEALLMALATLFGLPLPLSAVQILYVNLATDGLPALALAIDPPEDNLMQRKSNHTQRGIFTRPVVVLMFAGGIWSALVNIGLFSWSIHSGRTISESMTMTFVLLVLIEFFKAYIFRSDRNSILKKMFANKWLNLAILWEILLILAIIYVPFLQHAFGTFSLTFQDILIILPLAFSIVPFMELMKWLVRKNAFGLVD